MNSRINCFRALCLALLLSTFSITMWAQDPVVITGVVIDDNDVPIIGARIHELTTSNGTVTDIDGKFSLRISNPAHTLEIAFVGYTTKKVVPRSQRDLRIKLTEDAIGLEELVVVGYQTMRKKDVTGAVASIRADELTASVPSVGQAMVGKVPGVQISQVSGAPYVGTKIRVRGTSSINASSDPLYVIDGYPANADLFINPSDIESIEILKDAASAAIYGSRAAGGVVLITTKRGKAGQTQISYDYQLSLSRLHHKVDLLNAEEFAELVVDGRNNNYRNLMISGGKDWDDSYFADDNNQRTKRLGKKVSGIYIPEDLYDFQSQEIKKPKYNTDWQDELYRTNAPTHRHTFAISGGSDRVKYNLSIAYLDNQGIIVTTGQKRLNLRNNIDVSLTDNFSIGANIALTSTNNSEVREGRFHQGPILGALVYAPIFPARNEDGTLAKYLMAGIDAKYGFQAIENPVALATETEISRKQKRNTYNLFAKLNLSEDLFLKANLGHYNVSSKYEFYSPTSLSSGKNPPYSDSAKSAAYALAKTTGIEDYLAELTANYSHSFADIHNLSGVLGMSAQYNAMDRIENNASGFEDDHIKEITAHGADPADLTLTGQTRKTIATMLSFFTRLNYNYLNRYYLTLTMRGDASSRFGPKNRWGLFPSISLAWSVSEEDFYKSALGDASRMKLRASWGRSGNNDIGNYNFARVMSSPRGTVFGTDKIESALYPEAMKDEYLGWESTSQYNVGMDLSVLEGRLSMGLNLYNSETMDLLFNQTISAISGSSGMSLLTNLRDSKIRNRGLDFQVDYRALAAKDYDLTLTGNISLNRNKVLDLGGASTIITNGAERSYKTHITSEGHPIGMFYGHKVLGMVRESDMPNIIEDDKHYDQKTQSFPAGYVLKGPARSLSQSVKLQPGDLYFEDINGDGVVSDEDKTIIGSPHPLFTYGFGLHARYKDIDLTASFNGSYGNKVLDGQDYYIFNMEGSGNQYKEATQRYRSESQPGNGQVYKASRGGTQSNSTRLSTFYLQDGSFLRCTNISIGYNVPKVSVWTGNTLKGIRLHASVDNPFTITKYKGYNPEVDYNNGSNLTPGVDYGKYPLATSINFGVHLKF